MPDTEPRARPRTALCAVCRIALAEDERCEAGRAHSVISLRTEDGRAALAKEVWNAPRLHLFATPESRLLAALPVIGAVVTAALWRHSLVAVLLVFFPVVLIPIVVGVLHIWRRMSSGPLLPCGTPAHVMLPASRSARRRPLRGRIRATGSARTTGSTAADGANAQADSTNSMSSMRRSGSQRSTESDRSSGSNGPLESPLSGRRCLGYAIQLRVDDYLGGDVMLADAAIADCEVALDDGRTLRIPAGRIRLELSEFERVANAQAVRAYLSGVDPALTETANQPPIPWDHAWEGLLHEGDRVAVFGKTTVVPMSYREAGTQILLREVPRVRLLVRAAELAATTDRGVDERL